jgi:hypothetical protein
MRIVLRSVMLLTAVISLVRLTLPAQAQPTPGDILVIDFNAGTNLGGALFSINPTTGARTLLSDFGNTAQGPRGVDPFGVAVEAAGTILVSDPNAGTNARGALFRVDPSTGARTLLSDFGAASTGPLGSNPARVLVMPTPSGAGLSGEWRAVAQRCARGRPGLGCEIVGALKVFNPGTDTAAPTLLQFFLSADEVLDEGDVLLQEVRVGRRRPQQSRTERLHANVTGDAGGLFVIAVVDATDVVVEINEANNVVVSPPIAQEKE